MPKTEVRSAQIKDATVGRSDINSTTAGEAVVVKIVAGTGVSISSTGADTGTGDVTITASGGGTPSAHQTTHQIGGTDVLLNAAWTNQANTFTLNQTLSGDLPKFIITDPSYATGLRTWTIGRTSVYFEIVAANDAGAGGTVVFRADRNATVTMYNLNLTGYQGNVVRKDYANEFTENQLIHKVIPRLKLWESDMAGDSKKFEIAAANQQLYIQALNDAENGVSGSIRMDRTGSTVISGTLSATTKISVSGADVSLALYNGTAPINNRLWNILDFSDGQLYFQTQNDAGVWTGNQVILSRVGDVAVGRNLAMGGQLNVLGPVYTGDTGSSPNPSIYFIDATQPVNQRVFRIMNQSGFLRFYKQDDGETGHVGLMQMDRSGNIGMVGRLQIGAVDLGPGRPAWRSGGAQMECVTGDNAAYADIAGRVITATSILAVSGATVGATTGGVQCTHLEAAPYHIRAGSAVYAGVGFYEAGRTFLMGYPQVGDMATQVHGAYLTGPFSWTIVGKTLFMSWQALGNVAVNAGVFNVTIPGGYLPVVPFAVSIPIYSAARPGWHNGTAHFTAGQYYFALYDENQAPWGIGMNYCYGSIAIPVQ